MLWPSALSVVMTQLRTGLPSMRTVQLPQAPSPQAFFTLVRCRSSRRNFSSFLLFVVEQTAPLRIKVGMISTLRPYEIPQRYRYINNIP